MIGEDPAAQPHQQRDQGRDGVNPRDRVRQPLATGGACRSVGSRRVHAACHAKWGWVWPSHFSPDANPAAHTWVG